MEKLGTKNIDEVLDFLISVSKDLNKHKADGNISTMEYMQTAITNAPKGLKAVQDLDQVDNEFKDMDETEAKYLVGKSLELSSALLELFGVKL